MTTGNIEQLIDEAISDAEIALIVRSGADNGVAAESEALECEADAAKSRARLASAIATMTAALAIADEWFGGCDCITTEFGTDERKKRYWQLRRTPEAVT